MRKVISTIRRYKIRFSELDNDDKTSTQFGQDALIRLHNNTFTEIRSMKALPSILRISLGSIFLVYGLDGFFPFMPKSLVSEQATNFISAMIDSGYLWTLLKVGETVGGAMLILNLYVPLALVLLAPIVVNVVGFHFFLNPEDRAVGIYPVGVTLVLLELSLAWLYREYFQSLFVRNAVAQSIQIESASSPEPSE